jgi:hypothetical protein
VKVKSAMHKFSENKYQVPHLLNRLVTPELEVLATKFAKDCAESREKLAKNLIEAGYNPDYVTIGERVWFDEETKCMNHECFAMNKDVEL